MKKELKLTIFIIIIITIIIIFCGLIKYENPDSLYIEMSEINYDQSLVGLSKERVVELLGEPKYEYNDRENKKVYKFNAGKIIRKSFWGNIIGNIDRQKYYELKVFFDENDNVEYTYIKLST